MDLNKLLDCVLEDTKKLGIKTGKINGIVVKKGNHSFSARCCKFKRPFSSTNIQEEFTIEVSESALNIPTPSLQTIIAHEVLHTVEGCFNHTKKWKMFAKRMNDFCGYKIQRTTANLDMSGYSPKFNYMLQCETCGMQIGRRKKSKVIEHPEKYKCPRCKQARLVRLS